MKRGNHLLGIAGRLPSSIPPELPACVSGVPNVAHQANTHTAAHACVGQQGPSERKQKHFEGSNYQPYDGAVLICLLFLSWWDCVFHHEAAAALFAV